MNTNVRTSLNHAYFYDALSGSFMPPCDRENVGRNLARLMSDTLEKGQSSNPNSHNSTYTYIPSWAPIVSEVHNSHWDIRSLTLNASDRELKVLHTLEGSMPRHLKIYDSDSGAAPVLDEVLACDSNYDEIQQRVKQIAEKFFEVIPPVYLA